MPDIRTEVSFIDVLLQLRTTIYSDLNGELCFIPVAIETLGSFGGALKGKKGEAIGERIALATDWREEILVLLILKAISAAAQAGISVIGHSSQQLKNG